MSLRLAAPLLALLFVCAVGSPHARADTTEDDLFQIQAIADAALDVQASIDDLKTALLADGDPKVGLKPLLADGDPKVRSVFSLLNNLHARAHEIDVIASNVLGGAAGADIEAIASLVMMQAAQSAQEDLRMLLNDVKEANKAKAKQRQMFTLLQQREHIAIATEAVVNSTNGLLDLFDLSCVLWDD